MRPNGTRDTRFGIMRHAATEWNLQRRIQGHDDSPLTVEGRQQAGRWGRKLSALAWDRILVSDLGRARQTAGLVNRRLGVPVETDRRLREQDWGDWTGMTVGQIKAAFPALWAVRVKAGWATRAPAGEDCRQVWQRSRQALEDAWRRRPGETILVVAHEGVLKYLIYGLYERQYGPPAKAILKPGHLHWLTCDGDGLRLLQPNAVALGAHNFTV